MKNQNQLKAEKVKQNEQKIYRHFISYVVANTLEFGAIFIDIPFIISNDNQLKEVQEFIRENTKEVRKISIINYIVLGEVNLKDKEDK